MKGTGKIKCRFRVLKSIWTLMLLGLVGSCTGSPNSYPTTLGMHVHSPSSIPMVSAAGFNALRIWDINARWAEIEPQKGTYRFELLERILGMTEPAKLPVILVLGGTPVWASARPKEKCAYGFGCAAEPAEVDDWRRYVAAIAKRFRGRIECYEPWNEASFPADPAFTRAGAGGEPGHFYSGSIASMVTLARVAHQEVKALDPNACVLSPSFHSTGDWADKFDRYLAAGGKNYIDVVSQHFYFAKEPEDAVPIIRAMRRIMAKNGMADTPLWNTEVGASLSEIAKERSNIEPDELVYAFLLRTYLLNISEGVSRIYWYAWDNGIMGFRVPNTRSDFGSRAATAAVAEMSGMDDIRCAASGSLWTCSANSNGREIRITWVTGKDAKPVQLILSGPATRWRSAGRETFNAGDTVAVDGRPVIVLGQ